MTKADDVRIGSVLNEPARAPYLGRFTDFVSLRLRALTLLAATVQLRQCEPEDRLDGTYQYDDSSPPSPGRFGSGRTAAQESNPIAFARTKAAIDRFCRELPETHALPWSNMDEGEDTMLPTKGRISKETAVLVRTRVAGKDIADHLVVRRWQHLHSFVESACAGFAKRHGCDDCQTDGVDHGCACERRCMSTGSCGARPVS